MVKFMLPCGACLYLHYTMVYRRKCACVDTPPCALYYKSSGIVGLSRASVGVQYSKFLYMDLVLAWAKARVK